MASVLIIDDEPTLRSLMSRVIELEGYHVFSVATARDAMKVIHRENIQVVVTDVKLPDGDGVELTTKIKSEFPAIEIIVLTAFGTIEDGVRAIKNGGFDYLTKGDHQERIIPLVHKAAEKASFQQRIIGLEAAVQRKFGFENIVGKSKTLLSAITQAKKVSSTDANVLLLGETGTGKEVFARAIHYDSSRKGKPFVALNCSAFPKDLIENELFGHVEGAFTGASKSRKGMVEEAEDGTLFMDEVGEMPIELQAKVLRLVEAREYYRIGDNKVRRANVRLVAATNRDLQKEVQEGRFREDLYYRLSVFIIQLPPLRDRPEDIEQLATGFATEFALKTNRSSITLLPDFVTALKKHSWKGNIRELKNIIERCVILSDESQLDASLLPSDFNVDSAGDALDLATAERNHILKVLQRTGGNKTQAARLLDIGLTTLYQKIKDYGL